MKNGRFVKTFDVLYNFSVLGCRILADIRNSLTHLYYCKVYNIIAKLLHKTNILHCNGNKKETIN